MEVIIHALTVLTSLSTSVVVFPTESIREFLLGTHLKRGKIIWRDFASQFTIIDGDCGGWPGPLA